MTDLKCYFCGLKVSMLDFSTTIPEGRKTKVPCHDECFFKNKDAKK